MGYKVLAQAVVERALLDVWVLKDPRHKDPCVPKLRYVGQAASTRSVALRLQEIEALIEAFEFLFFRDDPDTRRWYDWAGIDLEALRTSLWTPRQQVRYQRVLKEQALLREWQTARYAACPDRRNRGKWTKYHAMRMGRVAQEAVA